MKLRMNTQYIDFYLQKNNLTKEDFANQCNIKLKELNDVYNQKNIDVILMVKIVERLQISCDTFLFKERYSPRKTFFKSN